MVKQCVSLGRTIESKNVIYIWLTGHKGTNESYTLSKAFKKSIAKSWHSYNPYHQVLLNSYTVFELRHPRNYNHPYTQIECPSDFPQRLSYCSDDSSFKTVRYDCSHVNLANRVTAWNRHMAFTNSFVNHAHKYSHYLLQADKAKLIGRHPHCHSRRVKQTRPYQHQQRMQKRECTTASLQGQILTLTMLRNKIHQPWVKLEMHQPLATRVVLRGLHAPINNKDSKR